MRYLILTLILTSCAGLRVAEFKTTAFDESKYGVVSNSQWLIQSKSDMPIPSCDWLERNNIEGIDAADTYEITTDELCGGDL